MPRVSHNGFNNAFRIAENLLHKTQNDSTHDGTVYEVFWERCRDALRAAYKAEYECRSMRAHYHYTKTGHTPENGLGLTESGLLF